MGMTMVEKILARATGRPGVKAGAVVEPAVDLAMSHENGALGAFAFGIGATEMASVWALGIVLNLEVPGTIKVVANGRLGEFVSPKDLILHLIGKLTAQGANFQVVEFHGETIRSMSTTGRLVLCNMSVEAGATSGIVPADEETVRYLKEEARVADEIPLLAPDADASYSRVIEIDASALSPQVACPHAVDNVKPVEAVAGTRINQVVVGSCTNGRLDDLAAAARIVKGKKVAAGVRMLVFPASWRIYKAALKAGYLADLIEAGAVIMNPGCGSSREQAASALRGHNLMIVARGFARIFLQNAVNLGLQVVTCPEIEASAADTLEIASDSVLNQTTGKRFAVEPLPAARQAIMKAGGLISYTRQRLTERR
jgi:3-isopropylmalate/(R)-2-methylmalate dehydratase large subunit